MSDFDGNLALKKKRYLPARQTAARPAWEKQTLKTRRIPVTATPDPAWMNQVRARAIRRELIRRRVRLLSTLVCLVLLVAGVFAMIVYRQAIILEKNFEVVAMEQKIGQYQKEASQIREALAQNTNLDVIRQQAISRIGLQDPARTQMVAVVIPDTDRIVYASQGIAGTDDQAYLAGVFSSIEGYFKTFSISEPGD